MYATKYSAVRTHFLSEKQDASNKDQTLPATSTSNAETRKRTHEEASQDLPG